MMNSKVLYSLAAVVALIGGYYGAKAVRGGIAHLEETVSSSELNRLDSVPTRSYKPDFQRVRGEQLLMVFIGKASCFGSNREWLPEVVDRIKTRLESRAEEQGMEFGTVGIALDWPASEGVRFLTKFGPFDQVVAGGNWGNTAAYRFIWEKYPGRGATPQVVVVQREIAVDTTEVLKVASSTGDTIHGAVYRRTDGELIVRKVGAETLRRWAETGAAIELTGGPSS